MSVIFHNNDFILLNEDTSEKVLSIVNKYDSFLTALTTPKYEHVRNAIKEAIRFLISDKYNNTEEVAINTYNKNYKLKTKYNTKEEYLDHIKIKDKKSYTIDLATGTGKSWVIYGVAQIMLAEGLVDKVLVLCPSLTIEEELKRKFSIFSGDYNLNKILSELSAVYLSPAIKSANDPILNGDICVENIHAAYERAGSSIEDSFKGKGMRTLVISDEAHHIYSNADSNVKKWYSFLTNKDYDFQYLLGVTGTPYIENEYFHDIIYRYSLNDAMEDGIVKKIDYKVEEESQKDKGFDETYQNHLENSKLYYGILKPITIIVTDKIVTCIQVWNDLVKYISEKERISYELAAKKVIWVTSSLPTSKNELAVVDGIINNASKMRKDNLQLLKTVDDSNNPVEWIVSVSMLTEGWDVKNVFQIVPHEQRAFNSKLLISQVLGRGLRIPQGIEPPIYVKINNHEKWTTNIKDLYNEILEIDNRISWFYENKNYDFELFNFDYEPILDTIEIKENPAKKPEKVKLMPQSMVWEETSIYSETGTFHFDVEAKDIITIEQGAKQIKLFLKEKGINGYEEWSLKKISDFIIQNLKKDGYDSSFLTKENLSKIKQAFGPMLREIGKESPRMKLKPDTLVLIEMNKIVPQSFGENALRGNGFLFYSSESCNSLPYDQKEVLSGLLQDKNNYALIKNNLLKYGGNEDDIKFLNDNLIEININDFKTPLNLIYVSHEPEYRFTRSLFNNIELFDSFIKSPDKGFYSIPYSYKPDEVAETHVKRENFNPDFFLKLKDKNIILVVEIKKDGDSKIKNKAKYRDGKNHFSELNSKVSPNWSYCFYFLTPIDITEFFQAIRSDRYINWKSTLMQELE